MRARRLLLAAAFAAAAALVYAAAFGAGAPHDLDGELGARLRRLEDTPLEIVWEALVLLIVPPVYAVLCIAAVAVALRVHGAARAFVAAALLATANLTTQFLKQALAEPRPHPDIDPPVDPVSWPGGHSTAAMALALAALLAAPPARRALVARAGIGIALAVGLATVVMDWHYPSDVAGGFLVAGAYWAIAAAALSPGAGRDPRAAPRPRSLHETG